MHLGSEQVSCWAHGASKRKGFFNLLIAYAIGARSAGVSKSSVAISLVLSV